MSGRHGELAGHLFSTVDEFGQATLNALKQTIELARAGRLTYCIIPAEAEKTLDQRGDQLVPAADLCLASHRLADLDMRLICLLPDGHPPSDTSDGAGPIVARGWSWHGYNRFLAARERGEAHVDAAVSRIEARAAAARR